MPSVAPAVRRHVHVPVYLPPPAACVQASAAALAAAASRPPPPPPPPPPFPPFLGEPHGAASTSPPASAPEARASPAPSLTTPDASHVAFFVLDSPASPPPPIAENTWSSAFSSLRLIRPGPERWRFPLEIPHPSPPPTTSINNSSSRSTCISQGGSWTGGLEAFYGANRWRQKALLSNSPPGFTPWDAGLHMPWPQRTGTPVGGGQGPLLPPWERSRKPLTWDPLQSLGGSQSCMLTVRRPCLLALGVPAAASVLRSLSSASSTAPAKPAATASAAAAGAAGQGQVQAGAGKTGGQGAAGVSTAAVHAEELAEECEEALEDLGEVRKRAQAAREAVRKGRGVLLASWQLLGAVAGSSWRALLSLRVVVTWGPKEWQAKFAGWWKVIKHEAHHYWVGTKLLWADIRISSRLFLKTAHGQSLSRRERQQLMRTSADIFRLVPFAVFVIVPFMEFLLPVALRLFPNMLPSTYQDAKKEEVKLKRLLQARLQMAQFLQDTVQEMAKEVKGRREGEVKKTAEDLQRFMTKVRTGGRVSNEEILGFATLFNDELTLDNMTRPRLVSMCKYMGLQTFGTDAYLRYILRARLAWIKEDDKLIQAEGVESLSESELRAACRERGMLGLKDVPTMREQLHDWLDLSLNRSVPSSLLILSRSFLLGGRVRPEEAVQATLSSLPEKVVESVGASVPAKESTLERQRKLEKLQEEEKLIKEELEEERRMKEEAAKTAVQPSLENRDLAREEMREDLPPAAGVVAAAPAAAPARAADQELKVAGGPTPPPTVASAEELRMLAQERARANREQLCNTSAALAVLASSSAVSKERMDFLRLVNKEIELYNSFVEKSGSTGEDEARAAYAAAREACEREAAATLPPSSAAPTVASQPPAVSEPGEGVSEALINKVDSMLQKLEKELDRVDAKIGSKIRILDTDYDGKVTPEEVAAAASLLRDTLGQGQILELIANLAKDKDGKILVEDIVRLGTTDSFTHPSPPPQPNAIPQPTESRSLP